MPFILLFMLLFSSSVHSSRLLHSERRCLVFHPPLHALHSPLHAPLLLLCPFFAVAAFGAQVFGVSSSFSLTLLANVDVFVRRSANKRKFR